MRIRTPGYPRRRQPSNGSDPPSSRVSNGRAWYLPLTVGWLRLRSARLGGIWVASIWIPSAGESDPRGLSRLELESAVVGRPIGNPRNVLHMPRLHVALLDYSSAVPGLRNTLYPRAKKEHPFCDGNSSYLSAAKQAASLPRYLPGWTSNFR